MAGEERVSETTSRGKLWIAITSVVLGVCGFIVWSTSRDDGSLPALPRAEVRTLEAALMSDDPVRAKAALVVPSSVELDPSLIPGIRRLRPIQIDPKSFRALDGAIWKGTAHVGLKRQRWTIYVVRRGGRLQILRTELDR